jgi:hypothetical protein
MEGRTPYQAAKGNPMIDEKTAQQWQQIAIEIGHGVFSTINTPSTVGGDDETGYVLMFFNAKNHDGKSTLVSSVTNRADLKKLLKRALREIDGPKSKLVPTGKYEN